MFNSDLIKLLMLLKALCNVSWNLFRNAIARQVARNIAQCNITYLETAENVARQVAETVAESRTVFYFLQRFQATFRFVAQSYEPVAKCKHLENFSCNFSSNGALRDKLHETLHSVTEP